MRALLLAVLAVLAALALMGCGKTTLCDGALALAGVPVTDAMMALPIIAKLEDVGSPTATGVHFDGHGGQTYDAKLGPFVAHYDAEDYKGLIITTPSSLRLATAKCSGTEVPLTMSGRSFVELRQDPATGLYIVSGLMLTPAAVTLRVTMNAVR